MKKKLLMLALILALLMTLVIPFQASAVAT
jgi:hypothetical protein